MRRTAKMNVVNASVGYQGRGPQINLCFRNSKHQTMRETAVNHGNGREADATPPERTKNVRTGGYICRRQDCGLGGRRPCPAIAVLYRGPCVMPQPPRRYRQHGTTPFRLKQRHTECKGSGTRHTWSFSRSSVRQTDVFEAVAGSSARFLIHSRSPQNLLMTLAFACSIAQTCTPQGHAWNCTDNCRNIEREMDPVTILKWKTTSLGISPRLAP